MKCLAVVLLLVGAISASPIEPQYNVVPDALGKLYMVDLDPVEQPVEPAFDPDADIVFMLFTTQNPTVAQILTLGDAASIANSNFNPGHETRFTIHGWNGAPSNPVNVLSNAAYFRIGQFNMITVDWRAGSGTPNYITGRNRVPLGAATVARMIDFMFISGFVQYHQVHVIGHSLGGHMAGITGKLTQFGRPHVIYALDPAGPLFSLGDPAGRTAPGDGDYVEVMHTNSGVLGFAEAIGDTDFYPNGGRTMPGCGADIGGGCSHGLTANYYAESIYSDFPSYECRGGWPELDAGNCDFTGLTLSMGGPHGHHGHTGVFFLETNDAYPFSRVTNPGV